ncbi:MAG: hypothetical protein LQ348_002723 [Seirophora lacunosa]|nr:MAG: hypothetical protein LQ348_002723 [Seirophora lacunosa]
MPSAGSASILAVVGFATVTLAAAHDANTTTRDLVQITDSPGPPTIQPGIPALQPSIPTSGVPSLSIPPARQTSSSRVPDKDMPTVQSAQSYSTVPDKDKPSVQSAQSYSTDPAVIPLSPSTLNPSTASIISAPAGSMQGPSTTATSIPFLSDLWSQLFSQPSTPNAPDSPITASTSASPLPPPSTAGTSSIPATIAQVVPSSAAMGNDPKDKLPASMNSVLVYSLSLPPYSGGLDTSGIVETMTVSSPANDKTPKPSTTVYSYALPPYTPKDPTYVATSARMAPVSMTAGAPGSPTANAPATKTFLQQGFVDPTKDAPRIAASTIIPLYSPACLGNAYGGGYVITPTLSAANTNGTAVADIPPAYRFSYKLEPTESPAYSAAVVVVNTKDPLPTRALSPSTLPTGTASIVSTRGGAQPLDSVTRTRTTSTGEPLALSREPNFRSTPSKDDGQENTLKTSSVPTGTAVSGVLTILPTPGTVPNLSLAPTEGLIVAPDKISSMVSALIDSFRSTAPSSGHAPTVAPQSGTTHSAPNAAGTSCTTITTMTTAKFVYTPNASDSASIKLQHQFHRAAVGFNTTSDALSAELNSTFVLPGNVSETGAFEGSSSTFNVSTLLVVTLVVGICLLVGNNMVLDEWH